MKTNRRNLLKGASALVAYSSLPKEADAWLHPGKAFIGTGWNTLPLGAGGRLWGMHIANDGGMVCRGDVLGAYVWSGTNAMSSITDPAQKWTQVCSFSSLGIGNAFSGLIAPPAQPWEYVQAPGNSNYQYLVTGDIGGTSTYYLYYSTNKAASFTKSNVYYYLSSSSIASGSQGCYKVAADPNNPQIVYAGMPFSVQVATISGIISDGTGSASGTVLSLFSTSNGNIFSAMSSLPSATYDVYSSNGSVNYGTITGPTSATASLLSISTTNAYVGGTISGTFSIGMVLSGTGITTGTYLSATQANTTATSSASATINLTTFTPGTSTGTWIVGMSLTGTGVSAGTFITVDNGNGTYGVNNSQTVGPTTISGSIITFTVNNSQTVAAESVTGKKYTLSISSLVSVSSTLLVSAPAFRGGSLSTTFDRTLGTTFPTFSGAMTDLTGTTSFPQCKVGGLDAVSGIVFDSSGASPTTTIGGQTVTKRILVCIGGVDVYETLDGGQTWAATGLATMLGTTNFNVCQGFLDANGVYYVSIEQTGQCCRYMSGTWTDISPATHASDICLTVDPRPGHTGFVTISGGNGVTQGWTTTNADSVSPAPTWGGSTAPRSVTLSAASYDIGYLNYIFQQNVPPATTTGFTDGLACIIDNNGVCFWCGNQSIWYFTAIPNWGVSSTSTSFSFGRGQEGVVACDAICPPGASYPVLACQDIGAPLINNTWTAYPTDLAFRYAETTCQNLDYSPDDPSFIVARMTGQSGTLADFTKYSTDYGKTWTQIAQMPTGIWQANINGVASGATLTVNSFNTGTANGTASTISGATFTPGGTITGAWFVGMTLTGTGVPPGCVIYHDNGNGTFYVSVGATVGPTSITGSIQSTTVMPTSNVDGTGNPYILPYGTNGTTGTGGTGTYALSGTYNKTGNMWLATYVTAGQTMPVDKDHWIAVGNWNGVTYIPAYTANARGVADWALCQKGAASGGGNMPPCNYMTRGGWSFGDTSKPIASGYGTDLGTAWIAQYVNGSPATITLWRSTDSGATFDSVASTTGQGNAQGIYLLAVPGFPDELWLGTHITSGSGCLWHIDHARTGNPPGITLMTGSNLPGGSPARTLLHCLALGAPSSPGGYPLLYAMFEQNGAGTVPSWLYQGVWNSGAGTLTWSLYGPAGANQGRADQLPNSNQMNGIGFIRGDWNKAGRILTGNNGLGFAYYNP